MPSIERLSEGASVLPSLLPNKPSRTKGNSDPRSKPRKLNEMPSLSIAKVGSSDRSLDPQGGWAGNRKPLDLLWQGVEGIMNGE